MEDTDSNASEGPKIPSVGSTSPLIFISHDGRDADLAEAFSKLLKSVSAGMIKTFRSSDKKGNEGIDFGEEWYKRLMTQLQSTSDVVCLFTERSLDRPWILFEAGVAKGKLNTPVVGVALGVPLSRITAGPFYQFMNMDDSEADLTKLVYQLARRVPSLELDEDVVKSQVRVFKASEAAVLEALSAGSPTLLEEGEVEESAVAKLSEEMKGLPARVAEHLVERESPTRRSRSRYSPRMVEEVLFGLQDSEDFLNILMATSLIRDELPWFYELGMEAYRACRDDDLESIELQIRRLHRLSDGALHGSLIEQLGSKESRMLSMEFPRMLAHILRRSFDERIKAVRMDSSHRHPVDPERTNS